MMSQDILFNGKLYHLSGFANGAIPDLFWTADFQILCTTISAARDCSHVWSDSIGLISICIATFTTCFWIGVCLSTLRRFYAFRGRMRRITDTKVFSKEFLHDLIEF